MTSAPARIDVTDPNPEVDLVLQRGACRLSYYEYFKMAWVKVEKDPFVDGWHIGAICEHLQAVSAGQIQNLLMNVPPGTSKSVSSCVLWPTWEWGPLESPETRWLHVSYDQNLSTRDAVKARALIADPWYRTRWPHVQVSQKQDEKTNFKLTEGGYRISTSIGGHGVGEHPHRLVVDDPHNTKQAESDQQRQNVINWWDLAMGARGAAVGINMRRVVVMQRLHQYDLSGYILATERDDFVHLMLPMEYEPKRKSITRMPGINWYDPRSVEGELLDEARFPRPVVEKLKKKLASYGAAGQLQQRPDPHGGGEIKRDWWKWYDATLVGKLNLELELQSWDTALTDTTGAAKTAALEAGRQGAKIYLQGGLNDQMSFAGILLAVQNWKLLFPRALKKLIENSASGPGIFSMLRHRVVGLQLRKIPKADKIARLRAVSPLVEAGNVLLPGIKINDDTWEPAFPWVAELIEQCALGLASQDKDLMDAFSQLLAELEPAVWTAQVEEDEKRALEALPEKSARELFNEKLHAMQQAVYDRATQRKRSPYRR